MSILNPISCNALASEDGSIRHGFFTREGGVSTGIYEGLNVGIGSSDQRDAVVENRKRVADHFGVRQDQLVTPFQVHSDIAITVDGPFAGDRPHGDAVVTNKPELAIGILTADCGPVLFCDETNGVIGAAHAGWKGATGGILESTVEAMIRLGAQKSSISATLGPTISQASYEVGPEFVERLMALDRENERYLHPSTKADHAQFDLADYIVDRLSGFGIKARWTGHCTYQNANLFFSYRRTTHRAEPDYGRQISAIAMTS